MNFNSFLKRRSLLESEYGVKIAGIEFDVDPLSNINNNGYVLTAKDPYVSITLNKNWDKPIIKFQNAEDLIVDGRMERLITFFKKFTKGEKYDINALIEFIDKNMPDVYRTTNRVNYRRS